jgi:hypothetical protein
MSVLEFLGAAGLAGMIVGGLIMAVAVIVMLSSLADVTRRLRAYAFVLVGASVTASSSAVFLLSRLGETLPLLAGIPVIGFLVLFSLVLRVAASRAFAQVPKRL